MRKYKEKNQTPHLSMRGLRSLVPGTVTQLLGSMSFVLGQLAGLVPQLTANKMWSIQAVGPYRKRQRRECGAAARRKDSCPAEGRAKVELKP